MDPVYQIWQMFSRDWEKWNFGLLRGMCKKVLSEGEVLKRFVNLGFALKIFSQGQTST